MENTKQNRLKFYAQHLGQNIIIDSDCFRSENGNDIIHTTLVSVSLKGIECDGWLPIPEHTALELKPLSLISIQDSDKIAEIENDFEEKKYRGQILSQRIDEDFSGKYPVIDFSISVATEISDYLRSKGYALPWMGLSVDKLQEYGWIKLKPE